MNEKLIYGSDNYLLNDTIFENLQEFWLGRMLFMLSRFPSDFIDRVLDKNIEDVYTLYDFNKMKEYAETLNDQILMTHIKSIPEKRQQLQWLFILRLLTFKLLFKKGENPNDYTDIKNAKTIHDLIKSKYPEYDQIDYWFEDLY